jgi:hypothetical protein
MHWRKSNCSLGLGLSAPKIASHLIKCILKKKLSIDVFSPSYDRQALSGRGYTTPMIAGTEHSNELAASNVYSAKELQEAQTSFLSKSHSMTGLIGRGCETHSGSVPTFPNNPLLSFLCVVGKITPARDRISTCKMKLRNISPTYTSLIVSSLCRWKIRSANNLRHRFLFLFILSSSSKISN